MGKIKLNSIKITGSRILFDYSVSDDIKKYFNLQQPFFIEYGEDVSMVPEAILAIPFFANFLPVAWVTGSALCAESADKNFVENVDAIKQAYTDMYPLMSFGGSLAIQNIVDCSYEKTEKTAAFFSGGVDSFCTLIRNIEKSPVLMTLWGADIKLTDIEGWAKVEENTNRVARTFGVDKIFIKTSFRRVLNNRELDRLSNSFAGGGWWGCLQHGIAITAHSAPTVWLHKVSVQYLGASFCSKDKNIHWASYPTIDENMVIGSCRTIHDSFELDRPQKIDEIIRFKRKTDLPINLRVCWESSGGGNCCQCEKCYRTMMGIIAAGANPKDFGFDMSADSVSLKKIKTFIVWSDPHGVSLDYLWDPIKDKVKINKQVLKKSGTYKYIKWLLRVDFSDVQNNRYRKRQQAVFNVKLAVKKALPNSLLKIKNNPENQIII
ncbi:MAG: hypothetical protein GXZ02_00655 [Clostridiales bacterium]|nr:hypothetical protein [Clostridiales bacterium]